MKLNFLRGMVSAKKVQNIVNGVIKPVSGTTASATSPSTAANVATASSPATQAHSSKVRPTGFASKGSKGKGSAAPTGNRHWRI
jgi:hypothetical protein